jgi:ABC-type uncharacterized transport system substrate-binding protein
MNRRECITLLGGAAVGWPAVVSAQPSDPMRRIGVLMGTASADTDGQARFTAFLRALAQFGWTAGVNVQVDVRWGAGDAALSLKNVSELVSLAPDVILATGTSNMTPLQQLTRTLPIVFVGVVDPVGAGFVASLAQPGGNATGFLLFEYGISSKWLELLKQIAPDVTRVAVLRNPGITSGTGQFAAIQSVAPSFGVELTPVDVRSGDEIERAVTSFSVKGNGGLIMTLSQAAQVNRDLIIAVAQRHRLPAVYSNRLFAKIGGLISYGTDLIDPYRHAAGYVDRILRGEKAANLPVQAPTKYEMIINLKTAMALGLQVHDKLLAVADEVIE